MLARQRELRRIVVECSRLPRRRCVTLETRLRKSKGGMIGIGCARVIRSVTVDAIRRERRVLIVRVATVARNRPMRSRQREFRVVMGEYRRLPDRRGMAGLTLMTKSPRSVIRVRRSVEISHVTLVAIGIGELVIAIDVARLALCRHMPARQRELGRAVVKRGRFPSRCRVALNTILWISGGLMIGIGCVCECGAMTVNAARCQSRVLVIHVAISASHCAVRSGEWEFCVVVRKG